MFEDTGYGSDRYVYVDGTRHIAGFTRTLRPAGKETSAEFEERMDIMARRLGAMDTVESFSIQIARRARAAVECTLDVTLKVPAPAPIAYDDRVAPRAEPRGSRGGQRLRLQPA